MASLLSVNNYHHVRGGADAMYFSHARLFAERGWKNAFFSMHHPDNLACDTSEYFADRLDYDVRSGPYQTLVDSARVVYSLQAKSRLSKMLDARPIDVAHYHCVYHHLSPSVLVAAKQRGIPTVLTAHDLKLACPAYKMMNDDRVCERCKGGRLWNAARHRCIKGSVGASALVFIESAIHQSLKLYDRYVDRIIAPSRFYRQKLIEWGWDASKIVHIPNFVAESTVTAAPTGDYFLYFGRLAPEKGLKTLVRAAAQANVALKIAGTGPDTSSLMALAEKLSAPVEFVGFQSGPALLALIDGAKAVVLPSEWYENSPMSVIEAFARGKPLVGARIGGIPELIVEGVTGWSFEAGNHLDLAERLGQVEGLAKSTLASMGEATRDVAKLRFSPGAYYNSMASLYSELGVR